MYICGQIFVSMDFTTVPRSLIYRERRSMEEFGAYETECLTRPLSETMLRLDFIQHADSENRALWCMNNAFYICTMILMEKDPRWRISDYKRIARPNWSFLPGQFQILTLSLAGLLLSRLEGPLPLLSKKGQTRNYLVSLMLDEGEFNSIFNQLYVDLKADPHVTGTISHSFFAPRVIDKECIEDVMSDRNFNWVKFTNYWKERNVRDIVEVFGVTEDEKHNVVEMLRQSSHGFYSAGCNDYPEQVEAMLNNIDEELRMQFNPEAGQNMEDDDSEQEGSMELKPWEEAYPEMLRNENASLRNELNQIKDFIKGAVTYDDVNEILNIREFGIGEENAKKIVSDAITQVENGDSIAQQSTTKDLVENIGENRKESTEDEKDRQILELADKVKSLTDDVNRLTDENFELRKRITDGDESEWIGCFDGFLHSSLNPQAIAKALEGITHSYFPKHERGFWWVFVTVLTEIGWIPKPNYKMALQWANLHFNCGWDWKKDNQFKFSEINEKIRSVQPSSKWNKSVTGNVIGDYYGELAKTMRGTFVDVVNGNKLLDRKEFILPGCPLINNGHK